MSKRIELFNQDSRIQQFHPLAEAIVKAENEYELQLSDQFKYGAMEYNIGIRLARAGDFYFVSIGPNKPYIHFDSLISIQYYFTELYNSALENAEVDPSWKPFLFGKAFWFNELAKL